MILAAKCAPEASILKNIEKAGISAVELYTNSSILKNKSEIIKICNDFSFKYSFHTPNDCFEPQTWAEFADNINAEIVVIHDNYWFDEWQNIVDIFQPLKLKLCVENTSSMMNSIKVVRRFEVNYCLDLEHIEMETCGVFEEIYLSLLEKVSHIHITGYKFGSKDWHTPIHYSPEHSIYKLDLLKKSNYQGMVVSEAKPSFQVLSEFVKLKEFYENWKSKNE